MISVWIQCFLTHFMTSAVDFQYVSNMNFRENVNGKGFAIHILIEHIHVYFGTSFWLETWIYVHVTID